jgi:hypothetical protein
MRGRWLVFAAIATVLLLWLLRTPSQPQPQPLYPISESQPATSELGTEPDKTFCGTVRGSIQWSGGVPSVQPIVITKVTSPPTAQPQYPNPNAPRILNGRLADAIVYLVGVNVRRSKGWNPSPTTVTVDRTRISVGGRGGRIGIVRRGQDVEFLAHEQVDPATNRPILHSVRGRGAAFFTQMLTVADRPVRRPMPDNGLVELSSGSGYCWLRGYLFVTDTPYAAVTGADGEFTFPDVPNGDYEAVCLVPNWHVDHFENDPELFIYEGSARLVFRPTVEKQQKVSIEAGKLSDVSFTFSNADFDH